MRNAFASEITKLSSNDERIVLLSGDIGNRLFNDYKARFPERFLNCGVAEANMTGMAAGMAACGLRPITYTITPFVTTRCLEQIRVDICYHNLPVTIVGVGAGLSYAGLGATHHSCEDIAFLRVIPNMTVICPGDVWEVREALNAASQHDGPVYIRLGKKGEPVVHKKSPEFTIGKGIIVRQGYEICLLSTGNMLPTAMRSADILEEAGMSTQVVSFHTIKPLDTSLLTKVFSQFNMVVTIEEHSRLGGLGGSIAEWLTEQTTPKALLLRIGTDDIFLHEGGGQDYARECFGLTPDIIAKKTVQLYERSDDPGKTPLLSPTGILK